MKNRFSILFFFQAFFCISYAQLHVTDTSVHVLAIGNGYYIHEGPFDSYEGINYSARKFLEANQWDKSGKLILSKPNHLLGKSYLVQMVKDFVKGINDKAGMQIGIIYYCGHGLADLSGSSYWVPGDFKARLEDTTFEFLSKKLLNMDEIIKIIIDAQKQKISNTRFIILSDCCSNRTPSKWYDGITYRFLNAAEAIISYDSTFIKSKDSIHSALSSSESLTFDDLNKPNPAQTKDNKPTINEFAFINESIRFQNFIARDNTIYYSSKMGEVTRMVDDPDPQQLDYQIGPICRRELIFLKQKKQHYLQDFFHFLVSAEDAPVTMPVLLRRGRE